MIDSLLDWVFIRAMPSREQLSSVWTAIRRCILLLALLKRSADDMYCHCHSRNWPGGAAPPTHCGECLPRTRCLLDMLHLSYKHLCFDSTNSYLVTSVPRVNQQWPAKSWFPPPGRFTRLYRGISGNVRELLDSNMHYCDLLITLPLERPSLQYIVLLWLYIKSPRDFFGIDGSEIPAIPSLHMTPRLGCKRAIPDINPFNTPFANIRIISSIVHSPNLQPIPL